MITPPAPRLPPLPFEWQDFLARARTFRRVAINLVDIESGQPNWPKYFLQSHAVELAIKAYLVLKTGDSQPPKPPNGARATGTHDLVGLYDHAVTLGLPRNALVTQELPHISELHQLHYARYPQRQAKPVALAGQYDDLVDQLMDDVSKAFK